MTTVCCRSFRKKRLPFSVFFMNPLRVKQVFSENCSFILAVAVQSDHEVGLEALSYPDEKKKLNQKTCKATKNVIWRLYYRINASGCEFLTLFFKESVCLAT